MSAAAFPPGWYPDPSGAPAERYFDGTTWTTQVRTRQLHRRRSLTAAITPASTPAGTPAGTPATAAPAEGGTPGRAAGAATDVNAAAGVDGTAPAAATGPAGASATGTPAGHQRRSLIDLYAVSANSAQQLLVGHVPTSRVRADDRPVNSTGEAAAAAAGWYPDPARPGGLRLFDGQQWTSRARPNPDGRIRHMPDAALRLHARLLAAQDAKYLRTGGVDASTGPIVVPRVSRRPSLQVNVGRSRSGSVWALLTTLLVVVSIAAAGYFAWQLWGTNYYTQYKQHHLSSELEHAAPVPVSVAPAPTGSTSTGTPPAPKPVLITAMHDTLPDSSPVGKIRIPKIGLNMVFVMGTGEDQLALGPGLWKWGVMPGTPGNATISGHRTTYLHPYRHIDQLKLGDKIYIDMPGQPEAVFEVRGHTIASPFDVGVTGQTPGVRLTLTTCNPVGSASQRLVVEAEEISGKYAQYALPRSQWHLKTK